MPVKPEFSIIAAIDKNFGIGFNGKLLCYLSDDLKRFKKITSGFTVIMGRKTFESLPVKPLPKRKNVVLSSKMDFSYPGVEVVHSVYEIIKTAELATENFIIGGASLYREFIHTAKFLYITHIDQGFEADTFFPQFNADEYKIIKEEYFSKDENNECDYTFKIYERI